MMEETAFFDLLKTCHSTASRIGTELPTLLSFSLSFSVFVSSLTSSSPFSPFKDPMTAFHNSEHHPVLLQRADSPGLASFFLVFFAVLMSQSQHVGTNKSFWFIHFSRAVVLVIALLPSGAWRETATWVWGNMRTADINCCVCYVLWGLMDASRSKSDTWNVPGIKIPSVGPFLPQGTIIVLKCDLQCCV